MKDRSVPLELVIRLSAADLATLAQYSIPTHVLNQFKAAWEQVEKELPELGYTVEKGTELFRVLPARIQAALVRAKVDPNTVTITSLPDLAATPGIGRRVTEAIELRAPKAPVKPEKLQRAQLELLQADGVYWETAGDMVAAYHGITHPKSYSMSLRTSYAVSVTEELNTSKSIKELDDLVEHVHKHYCPRNSNLGTFSKEQLSAILHAKYAPTPLASCMVTKAKLLLQIANTDVNPRFWDGTNANRQLSKSYIRAACRKLGVDYRTDRTAGRLLGREVGQILSILKTEPNENARENFLEELFGVSLEQSLIDFKPKLSQSKGIKKPLGRRYIRLENIREDLKPFAPYIVYASAVDMGAIEIEGRIRNHCSTSPPWKTIRAYQAQLSHITQELKTKDTKEKILETLRNYFGEVPDEILPPKDSKVSRALAEVKLVD